MISRIRDFISQAWPPAPSFTAADLELGSQRGRVFIISGGHAGVGFELCKLLYKTGATIYIASRSQAKVEESIKKIQDGSTEDASKCAIFKYLHIDLADFTTVKAAAATFSQQESKVDVLWNNAGIGANLYPRSHRTAQGYEPLIAINTIAHFLFTELLLPQLRAAAAASEPGKTRVVWLASALVDNSPPNGIDNFENLATGTESLVTNYSRSKAGVWFLGTEFARRYGGDGILSVPTNPGNLQTGMWKGTNRLLVLFLETFITHPAYLGGFTELYAGLSPELTMEKNGRFVIPWGRLRDLEKITRQDILKAILPVEEGGLGIAAKFWDWCAGEVKEFL